MALDHRRTQSLLKTPLFHNDLKPEESLFFGLQNNGRNCIHLFRKLYFTAAEGIPAETAFFIKRDAKMFIIAIT
ncbi:hypothetical protein, partial [Sutterella wadsworthensis]|uniref:hypothetical protein n=1 Tax=Sutterella wadsworthensis TaxID=40545 RepID=UPI003AB9964E